jgi:hypothetical protein
MSRLAWLGSTTPIYKAASRFPDLKVFRDQPTLTIRIEPRSLEFWE